MAKKQYGEKIIKLRHAGRIKELEVERVVDLCLEASSIKSLLDIGTGSGLFAEAFDARGLTVAGIDPDPEMIAAARAYLEAFELEVASAEKLPFADNTFDACFLGMVLHEVSKPARALKEAHRVAAKLVAVLEWPYPGPEDPEPPARRLKRSEIEAMARKAGFEEILVRPMQNTVLYLMLKMSG